MAAMAALANGAGAGGVAEDKGGVRRMRAAGGESDNSGENGGAVSDEEDLDYVRGAARGAARARRVRWCAVASCSCVSGSRTGATDAAAVPCTHPHPPTHPTQHPHSLPTTDPQSP